MMGFAPFFFRLGKFYNGPPKVDFKKGTLKLCSTRGKILVCTLKVGYYTWPGILPDLLALFRHAGSLLSMAQDCPASSFSESAAKKKYCQ